MVINRRINIKTNGKGDMVDITAQVAKELNISKVSNGIITIFVTGSTASISTIEYEDGLISDFKEMWDRNIPTNVTYQHDLRWGDGNGYSHVRASLLGPSLVIPFEDTRMVLGTWQQIIVVDFDNRPRSREIFLQIMGE